MPVLFDEPDLFSSQAPAQRDSATSRAAARQIAHELPRLQKLVYDAIRAAGERGLTDEQGIMYTSLSPSTYRPRRIELVTKGSVIDSGKTQLTRSKRKATVWVAK